MLHGIAYWTGLTNGSGQPYLFWSGLGSDLGYLGALAMIWRHMNCHADGCKRIGRHHVHGTPFKTCRGHHPTKGNRVEDIHRAHSGAA